MDEARVRIGHGGVTVRTFTLHGVTLRAHTFKLGSRACEFALCTCVCVSFATLSVEGFVAREDVHHYTIVVVESSDGGGW